MIPLTAREALDPQVVRVMATTRPQDVAERGRGAGIYAVFDEEADVFLGLVTEQTCARFPQRIFADLLPESQPQPVTAEAPVEDVAQQMATEGVEALPALDEKRAFLGVVTRLSLLEALLRREGELLAEARRLQEQLRVEQQRLVAWSKRLEELNEASRTLLGLVGQTAVERAFLQEGLQALATLLQARSGAIGLLDEVGGLQHVIVVGLALEEVHRFEELLREPGVLGLTIRENQTLRLEDLGQDPRHAGFPPNHPLMKGFLAVPISHQGHVYGQVYLCDKTTGEPFTEEDEHLTVSFARSLALALAHARELRERKQAEEALRESEQTHRMVLENVDEVVYMVRMTGDDQFGGAVEFVSDRVENILGYEPDEFLNDPGLWFRSLYPDDVAAVQESTHHIIAAREGGTRVYRLRHKETGGYRWMEDRVVPQLDGAGNVIGIFGVARDLTERKRAEEALKTHAREQQVLLRFSQTLLGLLDAKAIARASFEVLREHLQMDSIGLRVPDANGTHLEMIAAEGWMKEHIDDLRVPLEPPEISGAAWAVHTRTPVFGDHSRPDRPFAGPEVAQRAGVKACLHVPIMIQQRVVGVLTINSLTPHTYTDEEVRFVTLVTNQAGIALDRAQKHQALGESEERYRSLFENSIDAVLLTTPDGGILSVNPEACRIFGLTEGEFRQRGRAGTVDPTDPRLPALLEERARTGRIKGELTLIRKDGTRFPGEVSSAVFTDKDGLPKTSMIIRDITERKQAEEALREMNVALENAMPGISRLDPEGRYVNVNEVYARMLGYEPSEMIGTAWAPTVHPDDQKNAIAAYERMLSEGKAEFDARALRKDGSVFHKQVLMVKIVHKDGKFIGHHCFMRDITERKRAEESLQALYRASLQIQEPLGLQERLARLLQTARDVLHLDRLNILLADPEGRWLEGVATLGTKEPPEAMRVPIGPEGGGIAQAYLSQQPIIWWDSQVPVPEPIRLQPPYNRLEAFRSRAFALLPLVVQGQAIGVLGGDRKHSRRPLDPATLDLMQLFAAQAAIAIENARLYEATVQRAWQLATLNEVSRTLTTLLDPRRVAQQILAAVQVLIPGAAGRLWERVGETDVLRLVAAVGLREPEGGNTLRLSPREGLAGIAAATRQPVISPDVTSDPRFANPAWAAAEGLVACIVLPLIYGERVHGVLLIFTHEPHTFTDEEVSLLRSFAAQAAIALENARLFEQVRAGRRRLQVLSRKLVEVQEAERRHIARELHDEIGQVLTGLKLTLEMSSRLPEDAARTSLVEAQTLVNDLIAQVRELSLDLRPAILDDLGLLPALLAHFERYTAKTRVRVAFEHAGLGRRFPSEVETAAYRIVQEALTNIARHAGVGEASVGLWADEERLGVHIEDGGAGFDPDAVLSAVTSSGLVGMRERAALVGGHLSVESARGAGTQVMADLPLGPRFEKRKKER